MQIETSSYQFSHGRKPSGYGYWIFRVTVKGVDHMVTHTGKYGDAGRKLWAFAKTLTDRPHNAKVTVMP